MKSHIVGTTNYLLIDISNSFTKLAFATRRRILDPVRIPTDKFTSATLGRFVRRHSPRRVRPGADKIDNIFVVCSCGGGRGDLRMSGHRCRFRDGSHLRYRLCATKIHRRSNCTWIGIDDEFSLSAHCTVAEAFSTRAALGGWKIDNRGDALRCGDRLSRTGAGDHCQDQDRAFSSEESARNCDGRLRGFDRCALGRDRCRAFEFDSGRPANCRKSQLLTGRDSCCPASGRILLKRRQNLGLSSSSRKGFMWGRP